MLWLRRVRAVCYLTPTLDWLDRGAARRLRSLDSLAVSGRTDIRKGAWQPSFVARLPRCT
jgi:hypothetical protein